MVIGEGQVNRLYLVLLHKITCITVFPCGCISSILERLWVCCHAALVTVPALTVVSWDGEVTQTLSVFVTRCSTQKLAELQLWVKHTINKWHHHQRHQQPLMNIFFHAAGAVSDEGSAGLLCSTMWCFVEYKWKRVPTSLHYYEQTDAFTKIHLTDGGEGRGRLWNLLLTSRRAAERNQMWRYNCFTIPVWRQWLWSGGGWLTLQSWSINWARSAPSSGSLQLGPVPDLGSLGSTVTSVASRRHGKPRERTRGYSAPNLADFPRKSSTKVFCN